MSDMENMLKMLERTRWLQTMIFVFFIAVVNGAASVTYAFDNDVLKESVVTDVISKIKNEYKSVEQRDLEKECILAVLKDVSGGRPADACISGMVAGLHDHSIYLKPSELTKALSEKNDILPIVSASLFDAEIAYISIPSFAKTTKEQLLENIENLTSLGMPFYGIIIDLRNNPGGPLANVIDIANLLVPKNTYIAILEYCRPTKTLKGNSFKAIPQSINDRYAAKLIESKPMVVLVNNKTASGAELLAAALRDSGRATIVGDSTAKKGDVQTDFALSNNGVLRLTTMCIKTPKGSLISEDGVQVDITVHSSDAVNIGQRLEDDPVIKQAHATFKVGEVPGVRWRYKYGSR